MCSSTRPAQQLRHIRTPDHTPALVLPAVLHCVAAAGKSWGASEVAHEARVAVELGLRPGMKVLDCGCGVGGPMRTVASVSGAHVTGWCHMLLVGVTCHTFVFDVSGWCHVSQVGAHVTGWCHMSQVCVACDRLVSHDHRLVSRVTCHRLVSHVTCWWWRCLLGGQSSRAELQCKDTDQDSLP
eukprot:GHRQ01026197.1.p1 GENE.GHRQ01026197.1~~GHRQ01026197.1.p1  ORF type:complete len:183 (-),score=28.41 GHRQ01026197.1:187-735(-)